MTTPEQLPADLTAWLLTTIPPELGPWLSAAAASFDVIRPLALVLAVLVLILMLMPVVWVIRRVTR